MTPRPPSPHQAAPKPGASGPLSRRALSQAAGGLGLAVLVAGCGGKGRGGTATATPGHWLR